MALKDWARRKNRELRRKSLEDRDSHLWHSGAYHRSFEGYTEYKETDEKGKSRVKRVYTGTWYIQALPESRRRTVRCVYVFLFLLLVGAMVLAAWAQGGAGRAFYAVIPEIVTLCLLARLFYVLFVCYLFAPRKMTVGDYRSSSPALRNTGLYLAIAFAADALAALIDRLVSGGVAFRSFPLTVLAFLLGASISLLLSKMESNLPYETEESADVPQEGGVTIDSK